MSRQDPPVAARHPSRLRAIRMLAPVLAIVVCACRGDRTGAGAPPVHVVLITIDTLRADRLGSSGFAAARTPALDALARESIVFEDATTSAPITLVAHATLLTGLTPPAHGVRTNGSYRLPESVETLAEILGRHGFVTAAFVGAFVLHHEFGLDQGFRTYDDTMPRYGRGLRFAFQERRAAEVLARAGDWALAHRRERFFLWAHVFDPHAPYEPPAPFDSQFADSPYDGEIAYVDAELGRFLGRLREGGILDRAVVIVTADHGEGLGEHGESTHGLFLYQSTLHVPLLVRLPGGKPGSRSKETAGLVDVAPTILSLLGVDGGDAMEGRPLPGVAPPRDAPPRGAAYYAENLLPFHSFGWAPLHGYREGRWKIIRAVGTEIYDLESDPDETRDLAASGEPEVAELGARLQRALAASSERLAPGAENPDLSVDAREKLLALGYVAGAAPDPGAPPGPDPREMLPVFEAIERAKNLLRSGRSDEAVAELERLASKDPPSVAVLNLLGQSRMERGEIDPAMRVLERARAIAPNDTEIHRRLAEGHYARGEYEKAIDEAREALRLNDRNAESRSILGAALARLGRHDEAIASFREAIAQRPEEPALAYNLGLALESAGFGLDAESAFSRAVALDPGSVPARIALGRLLLARSAIPEALSQLEEAVRLEPENVTALEQSGIALARAGDPRGALSRFDLVVSLEPDRAEGHYNRAIVLETLGRTGEAADAYRRFLALWKGDPARLARVRERLRKLGT